MSGMDDLVQFLRDRLDEDEQAARAATWDEQSDVWTARPPQARYEQYIVADYLDDGVVAVTPENADVDGVGQHIARHDPARVLREVEAKRRILDGPTTDTLIKLLALPYADHADYQDTWRP
ncbi:DUF6221 family protein [Streptomyces rubiginosohelvolus]|uniref:DUF6221 family protein n=1 Tax=Streptomyces rubiginosohelvolus TaxID=67362 RepID=UPI003794B585